MRRILVLLLTILMFGLSVTARAEDLIREGEVLDLPRCLDISLKNHPTVIAALNTLQANRARIGQARAAYYPQVNWSSGYNRINPVSVSAGRIPGSTDSYDQYASSLSLSQNLFDFGKTAARVGIQTLAAESSHYDLETLSTQLVYTVKQAYYNRLQASKNRDVARESVRQFQQHLARAKGFYELGVRPKFDVTKAELDLSNAKLNLLKAENAVQTARIVLNNALGISGAPDYEIEDNLGERSGGTGFEAALGGAYERRPDLLSLAASREAAQQSIELAQKGYYPQLSGSAAYQWSGKDFPLDREWEVGATLAFPLFSGLSTKYQVEEARSNLAVLKANEEALRQTIRLEVEQAWLAIREARERIAMAELAVRQADENYQLAEGRYAAGVGNPIEVTDALVALGNAKNTHTQALCDYKVAQAGMEKAMGLK
ncbi:MAG: TolC family protein [Deltaproteobacteria bacterium]|nr:TolC family protein [Deltaproteobacteria bacterium]